MGAEVYNPDIETIISTVIEGDEYNVKMAERLVNTLNKYYGNAGLRARLSDHNELTVAVKHQKATSTTTRGRRAVSTINIKCGDIQELIDQGKSDKEIMAHYNIPRATYYRKKKRMESHKDMARPF
jgi:hypothetical protein